jgi:hypothetical protein
MRHRAINWLVLGFAALWFNVVLPVHKRGQITLGGPPESRSHGCCKTAAPATTNAAAANKGHCPVPGSRPSPCAVCFYMAGLCTPPPVTVVERRLGYAGERPLVEPAVTAPSRILLPLNSRAPPPA